MKIEGAIVGARLQELGAYNGCQACSGSRWNVLDSPLPMQAGDIAIPCVVAVCARCACVRLFAIGGLGLMEPSPDAVPPAPPKDDVKKPNGKPRRRSVIRGSGRKP